MKRLAIVTTHPIQYYAPLFRLLQERKRISIRVFYSAGNYGDQFYDPGFGQHIRWDIPLLDGYEYEWAENNASKPGTHHFRGIITPSLPAQITSWQPNALLVIGWAFQSHLQTLRHFSGKLPIYFRGDSTLLDEDKNLKEKLKYLLLRRIYRHVDHAFYVGTANKAYFQKYGFKDEQLSFTPHAVDNERFSLKRLEEARQLRTQLNIPEEAIVILFSGKFEEKKSPILLLQAYLESSVRGTHLLFCGAGKLESKLRHLANGHPHIHFLPFQTQSFMPVIYNCCDLFCLPSGGPEESWGLAVNEAMAVGKAVLVSDKTGCATDLVSSKNGAIFSSNNRKALAQQLKMMTPSLEFLRNLGRNSQKIIQDWNFTAIAVEIERKLIED
ncbi:glycosyltransferase family 4 protein [Mucilaginibacter aquaedulcis]|uniref:glycosyltransferase family 4 protein n=1 Tax=Mucilaginibacter aquaedulcis TaxID=1187081 RepID=UPI0025B3E8C4|nr:glycosyltransferase family 4 protein [Mucilaginibacter aquaedulcis]MDN3548744.1 glycosyltransferase family 4 protein [Mucilaginibacter aquaedulcis]